MLLIFLKVGLVCIEGVYDYSQYNGEGEHFAFSHSLGQAMLGLSEQKKCVVIFLNQARSSFLSKSSSAIVPALGSRFYYHAPCRICMDFVSDERTVRKFDLQRWNIPYEKPFCFVLSVCFIYLVGIPVFF